METTVNVLVLRTAGTNCNEETAAAFRYFGAQVDEVHITTLVKGEICLHNYHILALPGGFTYGDDIASGRILANELRIHLGSDIRAFIKSGKLILGICNGFQILVKAGFLPGGEAVDTACCATLATNDSGKFEDRWTRLSVQGQCLWTKGLPTSVYYPVAHAEGKFVVVASDVIDTLKSRNQIIFRYTDASGEAPEYPDNPNGSVDHIAGITDRTGRVLGLMPHPERHFFFHHHPAWTREISKNELGDGARIFENGVAYARKKFCS